MERSSERSDVARSVSSQSVSQPAHEMLPVTSCSRVQTRVPVERMGGVLCRRPYMSRMLWSGGARQENEDLPLRGIERELIDGRGRSRSTPGTGAGRGAGFRDRHADSSPSSSRHRGKSVRWPGCGGSVIPHAAAGAVGALTVAVVETSFRTALMTGVGGPNRPAPTGRPARRRAVGMTAVTRRADGEGTAALTAGSLAEGLVHGVGARGAISDWTTDLNRVTTAGTGSVCRSSGRSRGSGWGTTGPSPHV